WQRVRFERILPKWGNLYPASLVYISHNSSPIPTHTLPSICRHDSYHYSSSSTRAGSMGKPSSLWNFLLLLPPPASTEAHTFLHVRLKSLQAWYHFHPRSHNCRAQNRSY